MPGSYKANAPPSMVCAKSATKTQPVTSSPSRNRSRRPRTSCRSARCGHDLLLCGAWNRSALHLGRDGDGTGAVLADRADGEEMIVGGDAFQHGFTRRLCERVNAPAGFGGLAPQDFESGALGIFLRRLRDFWLG